MVILYVLISCCCLGGGPGSSFEYGMASYYGDEFHGRKTASGETYNMWDMTCAHKTLPFGTRVRVTNLKNQKTVVVRVNDRGPFVKGRIIDLSMAAAKKLNMLGNGVVKVKIEVVR
jgi:rare lipoprotein A